MSHGEAATTTAPAESDQDSDAAATLHDWVRSGKSFSGNERKCCFINQDGRRFTDISAIAGFDYPDDGRALCLTDWDHDGDVDVWMANRSAPQVRILRNDAPRAGHFVGLRLQGTHANRDAIGARVEVYLSNGRPSGGGQSVRRPLVKTLRAGDGFLSQSSKRLHFGLGDAAGIEKVVVRWPGGPPEEFRGVELNRHYDLVQGASHATIWRRPERARLAESAPSPAKSTQAARVWLAARPPLPRLEYLGPSRSQNRADPTPVPTQTYSIPFDRPIAVNLWSASCKPCLEELKEWTDNSSALVESRVRILALCVDRLDGVMPIDDDIPPSLSNRRDEPFDFGRATTSLVDKLQLVHNLLFDRHRSLPVPSTLLIDAQGRLAAIYKGRVTAQQLAADANQIDSDPRTWRAASTPFSGRWHGPQREFRPISLANALVEHGFVDDAIDYSARLGLEKSSDAKYAKWTARIGNEYFRRDQTDAAIARYQEAIRLDPKLATAHLNLAVALARRRDLPEAESEFRRAVALDPDYIKARILLATLLAQTSRPVETAQQLQEALRRQPRHFDANLAAARLHFAHNNFAAAQSHLKIAAQSEPTNPQPHLLIGMTHLRRREPADAVTAFERALTLHPNWAPAADQLAWLLATEADVKIRNPQKAVALAEKAAESEPQNARFLDTLAAAYAAAERYPEAVVAAEKAIDAARKSGQKTLANGIEQRQQRYRERRPLFGP